MEVPMQWTSPDIRAISSKSKRKRLNRRKRATGSDHKSDFDLDSGLSHALVKVSFDHKAEEQQHEEDEEIEVVETEGFKRNLKLLRGERVDDDSEKAKRAWRKFCDETLKSDLYLSSDGEDSNDGILYEASDGSYYCNKHRHYSDASRSRGHFCPSCDDEYLTLKFKLEQKKQRQMNQNRSHMSENVDGYIGNKSMDYILNFIGEKTTKENKKEKKVKKNHKNKDEKENPKRAGNNKEDQTKEPKQAGNEEDEVKVTKRAGNEEDEVKKPKRAGKRDETMKTRAGKRGNEDQVPEKLPPSKSLETTEVLESSVSEKDNNENVKEVKEKENKIPQDKEDIMKTEKNQAGLKEGYMSRIFLNSKYRSKGNKKVGC
ncbi:myb-like protein X [Neocloeon triangulifer]|uniref:myb-like protein X n=1 Tax=Neocloeon triangulifer TaxID=2078957 RepID=UPI00286F8611|nr:myb-like protein X [Neocloeon triangulifer]